VCAAPTSNPVAPDQTLGDTGQHNDTTVVDRQTISGQIVGTLTVADGGDLTLNGQVTEDLVVQAGGRAEVFGMVLGNVVNRGGEATVYGRVDGRIIDEGGTTVVQPGAMIGGVPQP
jgi:hypothetical protein